MCWGDTLSKKINGIQRIIIDAKMASSQIFNFASKYGLSLQDSLQMREGEGKGEGVKVELRDVRGDQRWKTSQRMILEWS